MDSIKTIAPIFIGRTRSFWLGIVPAILTLIDVIAGSVSDGTAEPIATGLAANRVFKVGSSRCSGSDGSDA